MAWSAPRLWVASEVVLGSYFNDMSDQFSAIGDHETWTAYTCEIDGAATDPTYGSGATQTGAYIEVGNICIATFNIVFGTGMTAGSGNYRLDLTVLPNLQSGVTEAMIGEGYIVDSSGNDVWHTTVHRATSALALFDWDNHGGGADTVTHAAPFGWDDGDEIHARLEYQAV